MRIAFVCTGNTCRSAMAEGLAKKWLVDNSTGRVVIEITSAGLAAWPGETASEHAIMVMRDCGIDLSSHQAKQFSVEMSSACDIILGMTIIHKRTLTEIVPDAEAKVFTLAEFAGGNHDIPDPFGQPVEAYRECARQIGEFVGKALHKVIYMAGQNGQ